MIFIPGNVPSSKRGKVKADRGLFHSPAVRKYLQFIGVKRYGHDYVENYKTRPNLFDTPGLRREFLYCDYPVTVGVHFVRRTKSRFDWINMCQIVFDLLVAHRVIPDDDINNLLPVPMLCHGRPFTIDKNNPGVWIQVMNECKLPDTEWFVGGNIR
jgi:hypothetical protein